MRKISVCLLSLTTAALVGVTPSIGLAAESVAPDATYAFPSPSSAVIGSVGQIDDCQVGYFWSASRGDSVTETFTGGPAKAKKAILKLDVIENALNNGAFVDWTLSINGTDVGNFTVVEGQLGPFNEKFRFPKISGPYVVKIRVTNEVAGGEGSHTLRYDCTGPHSITLKK